MPTLTVPDLILCWEGHRQGMLLPQDTVSEELLGLSPEQALSYHFACDLVFFPWVVHDAASENVPLVRRFLAWQRVMSASFAIQVISEYALEALQEITKDISAGLESERVQAFHDNVCDGIDRGMSEYLHAEIPRYQSDVGLLTDILNRVWDSISSASVAFSETDSVSYCDVGLGDLPSVDVQQRFIDAFIVRNEAGRHAVFLENSHGKS